jgi:hypothetical protein
MAAGSAAERAEAGGKEMAKKRGREVLLPDGLSSCAHTQSAITVAYSQNSNNLVECLPDT